MSHQRSLLKNKGVIVGTVVISTIATIAVGIDVLVPFFYSSPPPSSSREASFSSPGSTLNPTNTLPPQPIGTDEPVLTFSSELHDVTFNYNAALLGRARSVVPEDSRCPNGQESEYITFENNTEISIIINNCGVAELIASPEAEVKRYNLYIKDGSRVGVESAETGDPEEDVNILASLNVGSSQVTEILITWAGLPKAEGKKELEALVKSVVYKPSP